MHHRPKSGPPESPGKRRRYAPPTFTSGPGESDWLPPEPDPAQETTQCEAPRSLPPWNESDSFRETTLQLFDDPADRHVGRGLYDLAVETSREIGGESSVTRAETRAGWGPAAGDLRSGSVSCTTIRRSAKECSLDESDEALARFAGKMARRV